MNRVLMFISIFSLLLAGFSSVSHVHAGANDAAASGHAPIVQQDDGQQQGDIAQDSSCQFHCEHHHLTAIFFATNNFVIGSKDFHPLRNETTFSSFPYGLKRPPRA